MIAASLMLGGTALAQDLAVKNARITLANGRVAGEINNPGMYPTYLVGATSDVAERVELRDARKKDARVAEVEVPAYGSLSLDPKALYLQLVNLKRPLKAGEQIVLILSNEVQAKTRVTAVVR